MPPTSNDPDDTADRDERPMFAHRPWMLGMILIFAVMSIIAGLSDPIWFLVGAPFILALVLYIYVWIKSRAMRD